MLTKELSAKVKQIEIKTRVLVNQVFSGEYHSVFKGRGMEFSEVREYQFGDDIRSIDWNVTARFGHPFVKIFEEERELTVILLVDLSGSQYFGSESQTKQQIAAEISALLAFSALKNNDKVGMMLFTDKVERFIPPAKTKSHVLRIISDLLKFTPSGKGTSLKTALEYMNKAIKKKSIVFLISDFQDEGYEKILRIVGKKHDLVGIVLSDKREAGMPGIGLLTVVDPETGEERIIDTSDNSFRLWYFSRVRELEASRKNLFNSAKLDSVNVNTHESYVKPLIRFFKIREKRW
ncbi:MAG: DUF58 domain-containing protein [Ignavibacteriaceae bacterium]|nr:DUF58 domain-containing protein [Ignavibacteriaceae bacterium]